MKPINAQPKFKCDFCKKKSVEWRMKQHEIICYLNPDRKCRIHSRWGYEFVKHKNKKDCDDCEKSREAIKLKRKYGRT